jgi:hypothetical protein
MRRTDKCVDALPLGAGLKAARSAALSLKPVLQHASGSGITETVRAGLELMAASRAYAHLLRLRGKVRFSRSPADLKADR